MNKHLLAALIILPFSAEAEPLFKKGPKLSSDIPMNCVRIAGIWAGECKRHDNDGDATEAVRLQIFQDNCTDLALYDFDYPIPVLYGISRQSSTSNWDAAGSFFAMTALSKWSADGKTFSSRSFGSGEYAWGGNSVYVRGWEDITIRLESEVLQIKSKGESTADGGVMDGYSYQDTCEYRKI